MTYTIEELKKLEDEYGSLDLCGTPITSLPHIATPHILSPSQTEIANFPPTGGMLCR